MNCQDFQDKWVDALEGNFPPDQRKEWEVHFQSCPSCHDEIQSLQDLEYELKGVPPVSPLPPVFWSRQSESILRRIENSPRRRWALFWESLFRPRAAFAAGMLAILLFFGYRHLGRFSAFELDSSDLAFLESRDESILDLSEDQLDRYYAYTVEKYFPKAEGGEDDSDEGTGVEELDDQQLNRAIQYFQNSGGRAL
jgi:hypothetical protein